ncbi:hypothetical protein [Rhabdothermincola sediminis]|uniref:hypothetical protein n=1 Tax=Rhabdothermincola sediminis TaxID=2751370 RepID=UPI001AA08674|nr:hypothetical protein [Rhabdothermincola sediminis]
MALVIALAVVVALLGVLVVGLLRSHAEILRRLHELGAGVYDDDEAPGEEGGVRSPVVLGDRDRIRTRDGVAEPRPDSTPAHDLAGTTPDGRAKAVGVVGAAHTTLLAFLSTGCGTCADFWRAFAGGEADELPGRDTRLVIVTKGPEEESPAAVANLAPAGHVTLMSSQAFADYGVPISPYFILVDGPEGRIVGEGAAATWAQVANLLRQAAGDAGLGSGPPGTARRRGRLDGPAREARADEELLRAGITPGHASLYPDRIVTELASPEDEHPG